MASYPAAQAPSKAVTRTETKNSAPTAPKDEGDRAMLSVLVPANAEIWLEGRPTKQTGTSRLYQTPPLMRGEEYDYEVRARWLVADRAVDATRHVKVRAGAKTEVDFTQPDAIVP